MAKPPVVNLWMTRTIQNLIEGPFDKEEICQKVLQGQLKLQDEVCQGNDYWFFLHEAVEVKKFLGIEVPRQKRRDDDDTQTETETATATQTQTAGVTRTDPADGIRAFPTSPPPAMRESFQPLPVDSVDGGEPITQVVPQLAAQGPAPDFSGGSKIAEQRAPYSEDEEHTEVQSLNIGREIAARIDSSVHSQPSVPAMHPATAEVQAASEDIAAAGKKGRALALTLILVVMAIAAVVYYFLMGPGSH